VRSSDFGSEGLNVTFSLATGRREASLMDDSIESLARKARDLYRGDRHEEALALSRSLADTGQAPPWVLSMIGTMYYRGRGTPVDRGEALQWYKRAAAAGDPGALTFLSGVAKDDGRYADARTLLEEAARQGHGRALLQLGYIYDRGLGVPRDRERARDFFDQAAAQGYVFAKRFIAGQLLRGDDGVLAVAKGVIMFVSSVFEIVRSRVRDPYSDKAQR
jgi:TPR repeat protein